MGCKNAKDQTLEPKNLKKDDRRGSNVFLKPLKIYLNERFKRWSCAPESKVYSEHRVTRQTNNWKHLRFLRV